MNTVCTGQNVSNKPTQFANNKNNTAYQRQFVQWEDGHTSSQWQLNKKTNFTEAKTDNHVGIFEVISN